MSHTAQPIIITGFMGAGKTTVAASLARQLNCLLVDLDEIIEQREGRSVPLLIRDRGEAEFRATETSVLRQVLEQHRARVVIALGGGAWTLERNRALISEHHGLTVWLDASFELCWRRITRDKQARPLAGNRRSTRQLYDARRPLYELATMRVDVNEDRSAAKVAAEIIQKFKDKG